MPNPEIQRENLNKLIGQLEILIHATQAGVVITKPMAECISETLNNAKAQLERPRPNS